MNFKVIVTTVKSDEDKEFAGIRHQENVVEMLLSNAYVLKVHETRIAYNNYGGITAFVTTLVQK